VVVVVVGRAAPCETTPLATTTAAAAAAHHPTCSKLRCSLWSRPVCYQPKLLNGDVHPPHSPNAWILQQ